MATRAQRAQASPTDPTVLVEVSGGTALVQLNRPARRNALSRRLIEELDATLRRLDAEPGVRAIILTGSGSAFSAGVDLDDLREDPDFAATVGPRLSGLLASRTPLIGAVNGPAYTGGLELALSCHFLVASRDATFADTHNRLGFMPGWGLSVLLPEAVGIRRARQISVTSEPIDAETALRWGLVNEVVAPDRLVARCRELADSIGKGDASTIASMLALYDEQQDDRDHAAWRTEARAWRPPHGDPR